ncbi:hypothetical protein BC567DRAFT_100393 [Phyllosticta citribraziliensis]
MTGLHSQLSTVLRLLPETKQSRASRRASKRRKAKLRQPASVISNREATSNQRMLMTPGPTLLVCTHARTHARAEPQHPPHHSDSSSSAPVPLLTTVLAIRPASEEPNCTSVGRYVDRAAGTVPPYDQTKKQGLFYECRGGREASIRQQLNTTTRLTSDVAAAHYGERMRNELRKT